MKKNIIGISLITTTCLYGVLAGLIILICLLTDLPVLGGIIVSIIILLIQFLISPWLTDLTTKWFYKAKFDYEIPSYLQEFILKVTKKHNMKYPKIGVIMDGTPNAYTYGRTKNDARIILSRGIFDLLSEDEVKAVVAHEIGHAVHYDMLFMTVLQLVPLVLYGIYEALKDSKKNSNSDKNYGQIVALIAYFLYIISQYIILWLSRVREYYADSFAVLETKNPNSLCDALVKIGFGIIANKDTSVKHSVSSVKSLGIYDSNTSKSLAVGNVDGKISKDSIKETMCWEMWNVWAKYYELSSTHPLISKRLLEISKYSKEYHQEEYITFDLEKRENLTGYFFFELFISFLPCLIILATLIISLITNESLYIGIGLFLLGLSCLLEISYRYRDGDYQEKKVLDLLKEIKVSNITSIPCTLKGHLIGRGDPGCIFNEDFVLQDDTGIMFLDYKQVFNLSNKLFAIFKSKDYLNQDVIVKGWYRRGPNPYVEIKEFICGDKTKKCHPFMFKKVCSYILLVIGIIWLICSI